MSPDHPHAKLLTRYYDGMAAALHDESLDLGARQEAFRSIADQIGQLLAPDFVIHTGGVRLAATGDREFTMAMGKRRNDLTGGTFRPIGALSIIADDFYAVVRGTFGGERDGRRYLEEGMGAWRFNPDGQASEHWELGSGRAWDAFFMACDPDCVFTSGADFWLAGA